MDLRDLNEFDGKSHPPLKGDPGAFKGSQEAGPRRRRRSRPEVIPGLGAFLRKPWVLMLSLVLVGVIGLSVGSLAWQSAGERKGPREGERDLGAAGVAGAQKGLAKDEVVSPVAAAEAFLAAESLEERLEWTRNGEETRALMEADGVAPEIALFPIARVDLISMGIVRTETHIYDLFGCLLENGSSRLVAVVMTDEGPRVDWEAFARHQPETWEAILGKGAREEPVLVRVFVERSDYYNFEYEDEELWTCYRITSPDLDVPLFGYGKREETWNEELRAFLERMTPIEGPERRQWVVMRLEVGEHLAERGQVRIRELVTYGWVE